MKIAIIRGDFANPWELQNFAGLAARHEVVLFTGYRPIAAIPSNIGFEHRKLFSPVDLNFGKISRYRMALLNRVFVDAHLLCGLETALKGFDIAHCAETYYSYTQQCLNAKKLGYVKKVVSTVWENIPFNNESIPYKKNFKKRSLSEVDLFLAVTNGAREALLKEGADVKKIKLLYPGVDLSTFRPTKTSRFRTYRKNSNVRILFVGRLVVEKGTLDLLEIYHQLVVKNLTVELFIAGSGPLKNKILEYTSKHQLENVFLLGEVQYSDMPMLYSFCDILVHPVRGSKTWHEQFGMVLVEAMACGLPVVALPNGSVAEIVDGGGEVVAPGNLPSVLKKLIVDNGERKRLSKLALRLAGKRYDAQLFSHKIEDFYSTILNG